jgi:hypothetical protein
VSTTLKIVVVAPIPAPRIRIAVKAKPGFFRSVRAAYRRSCPILPMMSPTPVSSGAPTGPLVAFRRASRRARTAHSTNRIEDRTHSLDEAAGPSFRRASFHSSWKRPAASAPNSSRNSRGNSRRSAV